MSFFVYIEQFRHFVEVVVFLLVLQHLPGDLHPIEDVPEENADDDVVSEVEYDTLAEIFSLLRLAHLPTLRLTFLSGFGQFLLLGELLALLRYLERDIIAVLIVFRLRITSSSDEARSPSSVVVTKALGLSLSVALAKTPTVGSEESTIPIASKPTSGPKSDQNMLWCK